MTLSVIVMFVGEPMHIYSSEKNFLTKVQTVVPVRRALPRVSLPEAARQAL
jgi:hypothetical protein